jgi:hypothetical protein
MLLSGSSRKLALLRHTTTTRGASVPRQYRLRRTRRRANTPGGAPLSADAKVRRHPSLRLPATQPPKMLREAAAHGAACSCQKVGAARRRRPPTAARHEAFGSALTVRRRARTRPSALFLPSRMGHQIDGLVARTTPFGPPKQGGAPWLHETTLTMNSV